MPPTLPEFTLPYWEARIGHRLKDTERSLVCGTVFFCSRVCILFEFPPQVSVVLSPSLFSFQDLLPVPACIIYDSVQIPATSRLEL